ncbi:MAG: ankyrin repeat domain-containing protein [Candidatus Chromulinivorax sp.]|nr:ankyrin repeat domain-containing protein [Candidatus Chromulinivorax sp.]
MKNYFLALLALCCAIQTTCSDKKFMTELYRAEYTEHISQIAQSCSSEHFNIPHKNRIPAQHGIPTLHEIAFKKLEPIVKKAITDLIFNKYDDERDKQNKLDYIDRVAHYDSYLLLSKFINAPIERNGVRLLHQASASNNSEITQYLLDRGANVNHQNDDRNTPLHFAAWNNADKAISLLITAGALVNQPNNFGSTPLHYAVLNNSHEVITVLIEAGADITIQNSYNKTPRMLTNNSATLLIFDQAVSDRPCKQRSATKIQALGRGFIARKNN